jgi:hypothetical protein
MHVFVYVDLWYICIILRRGWAATNHAKVEKLRIKSNLIPSAPVISCYICMESVFLSHAFTTGGPIAAGRLLDSRR